MKSTTATVRFSLPEPFHAIHIRSELLASAGACDEVSVVMNLFAQSRSRRSPGNRILKLSLPEPFQDVNNSPPCWPSAVRRSLVSSVGDVFLFEKPVRL